MSIAQLEAREVAMEAPSGLWREAWYRLRRNPGAIVGFSLVERKTKYEKLRKCHFVVG